MSGLDLNSIHILHLSSARTWRGGERQMCFLIESLHQQGIRQTVFCPAGSVVSEWCTAHEVPCITYRKLFSVNPYTAWQVVSLCHSLGITHLHTHDSHSHTFAVLGATLFSNRVPVIVHRRVDFPIGEHGFSRWKYNHGCIKRIICVSQFIRDLIAGSIKDPEKLVVVYSGVDIHPLSDMQSSGLFDEIQVQRPVVANIAAIAPHKDYYTFVSVAGILCREGFGGSFLIIGGDGGEMKGIRRFIAEEQLEDRVLLTGFRDDIPSILPFIDLLLFTSRTEGLGTTLLDAMAAGVPVVATRAGGIPELVRDGETGLLASIGDARQLANQVKHILEEDGLRTRLTEQGKAFVMSFSKEKMALQVGRIYQEVSRGL